ncbi:glyoxalase/bleomycin resistance protein/dioxygenase [Flavobacterium limnosediminis JC2902]|uniref:Glyoxalase/bleomycin resistance protein/dioxygenase n=1 Tax=Flavobacterium limnosediminis JC2902 TaxID=1341181 RepID=V6SL92_9FLAO|nr:VOC family protein [Flavobacterium limnosediminis]ESU27371.1 glyoxalase/bleomycin resistance protein/dioxygenase [Flavobacterium limnosediminis JC2902]
MTAQAKNPFTWVEIYVENMSRAQKFYETILAIQMAELPMPEGMGEMQMISFPWAENERNISGALVKMENMNPGTGGTLVYFACEDCATEESRVEKAGGKVLQPKMPIGEYGFCSIVMDTEGNTIGLHSMK